jgi:hypothetical protein
MQWFPHIRPRYGKTRLIKMRFFMYWGRQLKISTALNQKKMAKLHISVGQRSNYK